MLHMRNAPCVNNRSFSGEARRRINHNAYQMYTLENINTSYDVRTFIKDAVTTEIGNHAHGIKYELSIYLAFTKLLDGKAIDPLVALTRSAIILYHHYSNNELDVQCYEMRNALEHQIDELMQNARGWVLQSLDKVEVAVYDTSRRIMS